MHSRLTGLLGIDKPILQGGMAWIATPPLAAAVSKAGGLGILTSVVHSPTSLRDNIRRLRAMTDRPFGVNIMLTHPFTEAVARIVIQEQVPVVTTGAGNPEAYLDDWMRAGIHVIPVVPSVNYARRMERLGASAVIAEGTEAGGHIGETTTLCLVPQVADAVRIPVIAAGGIGDGRAMAAAFLLGAEGVQMGTRFLTANECGIHPRYTQRVLAARDTSTIVTGRYAGHPVRALKSPFTQHYAAQEHDHSPDGQGALYRAVFDGDEEQGSFMAGQIAGLLHTQQAAGEIVEETMRLAQRLLSANPSA